MQQYIQNEIRKTQTMMQAILADQGLLDKVEQVARACTAALHAGHKIIFAGNGGSAADSQHLAAELVSRFSYDRPALAAISLTTDTSALTAIGNDYAFEKLFSRQIEAVGQTGDVFIGITTSGKSPNILRGLEAARMRGMLAIGLTGQKAPLMAERCDMVINIPSAETPKIQEGHILLGHIICALIEESMYGADYNPLRKTVEIEA